MENKEDNDKEEIVFFVFYKDSEEEIPIYSTDKGKNWYTEDGYPVDLSDVRMTSKGCFQRGLNTLLLFIDVVLIMYLLLT